MPERDAFLMATVLLPVLLSLAYAHCGSPGLLYAGGGLGLGLALWWRQRSQMRQTLAEQAQAHQHACATWQQQLAEQQQAYRALQAARAQDDQAQQGWFVTISQELRMPLNTIIGYSEMLQEEYGQVAAEGLLADVPKLHEASQQLRRLICDIQDLAKMEAEGLDLCQEAFAITEVIEETIASLRALMRERGHTCAIRVAPELGLMWADRPKVRRSLENMLRHACLLAVQKTFVIGARRETTAHAEWLVVYFGEADAQAHLAGATAPVPEFAYESSDSLQRYGGTGLGLVVSQRLCRLMGGTLSFTGAGPESLVGAIRLPLQRPLATALVDQTSVDDVTQGEKSGAVYASRVSATLPGPEARHAPEAHSNLS